MMKNILLGELSFLILFIKTVVRFVCNYCVPPNATFYIDSVFDITLQPALIDGYW